MPLAEPFHLVLRQLYAPDGLLVEQIVLREDELQPPAFRTVLQGRAELLSLGGHHTVHEYGLTVFQPRYLVRVEPYALHLVGNIDVFLPYGHQFVGDFVYRHKARGVVVAAQLQVNGMAEVAALAQVLLFLLREVVAEVRAAEFRLPAYAVYSQYHLPVARQEGQPRVNLGRHQTLDVQCQGYCPVGLIPLKHTVKHAHVFKQFFRHADFFQRVPVHHVFVVAVRRSLLFLCRLLLHALCGLLHLRLLFGLQLLFLCHFLFLILVRCFFSCLFSRTDFIMFQELLYRVRPLAFGQVPYGLPVAPVVVDGHPQQAEMRRFLELAPEIPDEVFDDA